MRPVDQAMGAKVREFHYRGFDFIFDCRYCDERIDDGTYAFGVAREIYARDCYFKWHPQGIFERSRTVADLGANRGAFSVMMAGPAQFILSVDAQKQFMPIIDHNMQLNACSNYAATAAFVGTPPGGSECDVPVVSLDDLLDQHGLARVDFVKIDVEGSEFGLFAAADWLDRVGALSMELHTSFGDPSMILSCLDRHGFTWVTADENLDLERDPMLTSFVYAWRPTLP
jgi:hypothetical protein